MSIGILPQWQRPADPVIVDGQQEAQYPTVSTIIFIHDAIK